MEIIAFALYVLFFFGLGLLGAATLYWTVRYAEKLRYVVLFGCLGTALLVAQCVLVKLAADFGAGFSGEYSSGLVIGSITFTVIALMLFLVVAIHKCSNGK